MEKERTKQVAQNHLSGHFLDRDRVWVKLFYSSLPPTVLQYLPEKMRQKIRIPVEQLDKKELETVRKLLHDYEQRKQGIRPAPQFHMGGGGHGAPSSSVAPAVGGASNNPNNLGNDAQHNPNNADAQHQDALKQILYHTGHAKLSAVVKMVSELIETTSEQMLVFGFHQWMLDALAKSLTGVDHVRIDGTVPVADRAALVQKFQVGGRVFSQ